MKLPQNKGVYFCVVSLFTGLLTMTRPRPVSAVSTPAPTTTTTASKLDPNSRNSDASPLSKAMDALEIRPITMDNSNNSNSNSSNNSNSKSNSNSNSNSSMESSIIRSKLVQEETTLEDRIVDLILNGQWDLLQPNSGKSVVIGDGKSVSVSYKEEPGSGYRTWEWHGHVMVYEDGEGYMPEYVYGNYFEPLEDEDRVHEAPHMSSMTIGLGGLVSGGRPRGLGFTH